MSKCSGGGNDYQPPPKEHLNCKSNSDFCHGVISVKKLFFVFFTGLKKGLPL
jgi:hypothetical protein